MIHQIFNIVTDYCKSLEHLELNISENGILLYNRAVTGHGLGLLTKLEMGPEQLRTPFKLLKKKKTEDLAFEPLMGLKTLYLSTPNSLSAPSLKMQRFIAKLVSSTRNLKELRYWIPGRKFSDPIFRAVGGKGEDFLGKLETVEFSFIEWVGPWPPFISMENIPK